ncbi:hypothetical protein O7A70_00735 [Mesorhizobium sp. Cs1299R1N1]|uniref:hypothetical protein n=1 Tax=Mesorhizobium sp. Cs1299R1N1 TaxID=3015172 RepID=UPI00301C5F36
MADSTGAMPDALPARTALAAQLVWAGLSALWNVSGVLLMAAGKQALGPTASIAAAALLVGIAVLLVLCRPRWFWAYAGLSVLAGLMALFAVINAFTADPALWPSGFWRYAGAALNAIGVLAAVSAVVVKETR